MVERFIAKRLYGANEGVRGGSRPAILIATVGIALGLVVMIITLAVTGGFKHQIREKVTGFTQHIRITEYYSATGVDVNPITVGDSLLYDLSLASGAVSVQRYIEDPGIMRNDSSFQGLLLKGVGPEYDFSFLESYLKEGSLPVVGDSTLSNGFLLSRTLADRMQLKVGDRVDLYFVQDQVKARRLTLSGIYETGFDEYDKYYGFADIRILQRVNEWPSDQVSGIEIKLPQGADLNQAYIDVRNVMQSVGDAIDETYAIQTAEQLNAGLFSWLNVLNVNVIVILVLMLGISGFTMISGLLIIIFERTRTIGVLKAMGADNMTIRRIFLHMSSYIVIRGMLIGDVIAVSVCLIQQKTEIIPLDSANYYLDHVPMELGAGWFILLNVVMFLLSLLMLLGPSSVIARINPSTTIRFE